MPNPIIEHIDVNGTTYDLVDSTSGFSKSYKVTITKSGSTYSSDRTYSEISTAISSGNYSYIFASEGDEYFAPLQWNYDGTTDAITFVCLYNEVSETYGPVDSGNKNIIKKYQIKTDNSVTVFDSTIPPYMSILSYGSSTWKDFMDAYENNSIVYCRASSSSNPASGSQTRMAFMAYVSNATNPTNVEFQYYRSVSSHSVTQQGDQVYVYKLDKSAGWTVTVREASVKVNANDGCKGTYSSGTYTVATDLLSTTKLTNSATAATEVSNRVYPIALDSAGHLAVVVPWTSVDSADEVAFSGTTGYITENATDVEMAINSLDIAMQNTVSSVNGASGDVVTTFYVTISGNADDGYTANKTFAEVELAIDAGYTVCAQYGTSIYQLILKTSAGMSFGRVSTSQLATFTWAKSTNKINLVIQNVPVVSDVQVNGTSILSSKVANLVTNTAYNASSNKIATMSDLPNGADEISYDGYQGDITENSTDVEQAIHTLDYAVQGIEGLPSVTSSDNGKILQVVSGAWSAVSIPNANTGSF